MSGCAGWTGTLKRDKMAVKRTAKEIFQGARRTLDTASQGLVDMRSTDPNRRRRGMYTAVVFGRAVTFAIQTLRSAVGKERFNQWYEPRKAAMKADPLQRWVVELRNQIEKEGAPE